MPDRTDTWINPQIERLFTELFRMGHAHSVETWQDSSLVGGLYGVALGGVFFGESMFSFARDASKVALVHLAARLRLGGFRLLDTQFVTPHLAQFGAAEIPRDRYKQLLAHAVDVPAVWLTDPEPQALTARDPRTCRPRQVARSAGRVKPVDGMLRQAGNMSRSQPRSADPRQSAGTSLGQLRLIRGRSAQAPR